MAVNQGCRRANGLLMASGVLERHLAVESGFGGRWMPLRDAGYRRTTPDAWWGRGSPPSDTSTTPGNSGHNGRKTAAGVSFANGFANGSQTTVPNRPRNRCLLQHSALVRATPTAPSSRGQQRRASTTPWGNAPAAATRAAVRTTARPGSSRSGPAGVGNRGASVPAAPQRAPQEPFMQLRPIPVVLLIALAATGCATPETESSDQDQPPTASVEVETPPP